MEVNFEGMKNELSSALEDVRDIEQKAYDTSVRRYDIDLLSTEEIEDLAQVFLSIYNLLGIFTNLEEPSEENTD